MPNYSVAEAKNRLPALLAAAQRGEQVTITRYGKPIVELKAVAAAPDKRVTAESIDWLERQLADLPTFAEDSGALLERLRDDRHGA